MENLYIALSLALLRNQRFTISTNSTQTTTFFNKLVVQNLCQFDKNQVCEIDLLDVFEHKSLDHLLIAMTNYSDNEYVFKNVIIWKNVSKLSKDHQKELYGFITKIDKYNMNASRLDYDPHVAMNNLEIRRPELFTIVLMVEHKNHEQKIFQYLKEKFWFSTNYEFLSEQECITEASSIEYSSPSYYKLISSLRHNWSSIFVSPDIKRYIYSLIVHVRNHRLASLTAMQTRLPTQTIDSVRDLCIALVLWQVEDELYVTPDFVKVALRKIGYWLVDWEYNTTYTSEQSEETLEYQQRLEISMLTGDWYGCDYAHIRKYLMESKSNPDQSSPTGFTNRIIEDALRTVRPPL